MHFKYWKIQKICKSVSTWKLCVFAKGKWQNNANGPVAHTAKCRTVESLSVTISNSEQHFRNSFQIVTGYLSYTRPDGDSEQLACNHSVTLHLATWNLNQDFFWHDKIANCLMTFWCILTIQVHLHWAQHVDPKVAAIHFYISDESDQTLISASNYPPMVSSQIWSHCTWPVVRLSFGLDWLQPAEHSSVMARVLASASESRVRGVTFGKCQNSPHCWTGTGPDGPAPGLHALGSSTARLQHASSGQPRRLRRV